MEIPKVIRGAVAGLAVMTGVASTEVAGQTITNSAVEVQNLGSAFEDLLLDFPQDYATKYKRWINSVVKNPKVKAEIDAVAKLKPGTDVIPVVSFAENTGLSKEVLIIPGSGERISFTIIKEDIDGLVTLVFESTIDPKRKNEYIKKGFKMVDIHGTEILSGVPEDRICKFAISYDTKTGTFKKSE